MDQPPTGRESSGIRRRTPGPQSTTEWRFYTRLLFRLVAFKMKQDGVEYAAAKTWATPFVESELELFQSGQRINELPAVRSAM